MYQRDPFVRYTGTHATGFRSRGSTNPRTSTRWPTRRQRRVSWLGRHVEVRIGVCSRCAGEGALVGDARSRRAWPVADGQQLSAHRSVVPVDPDVHRNRGRAGTFSPTTSELVTRPRLLRFNGRRWSSVRSPLTAGGLRSVSCASANACTAVGFEGTKSPGPAVLRLHAGPWTQVRFGSQASRVLGGGLASISCPTANSCLATGVTDIGGPPEAVTHVALRQTGRGWSTKLPPLTRLPRGHHPNHLTDNLTAISCGAQAWHSLVRARGAHRAPAKWRRCRCVRSPSNRVGGTSVASR